jgi:hypothetical protein
MTVKRNDQKPNLPRLKLAHLPNKPPPRLRLGGFQPSESMPVGEYKVMCEGASKKPFAQGWRVELKHRVVDGDHTGVSLNQWIPLHASGVISPRSRYAAQCEIALGRPLEAEDDLNDPASIFSGRFFQAFVGFRKSEKAKGGTVKQEYALLRKDSADGLRVHDLLARKEP